MRTSVLIVAAILGCAMCQTPAPTNKSFCNISGTFCAQCIVPTTDKTNKSCESCGKNFVSTLVAGATDTKECKAGTATNCLQAATASTCAVCAANFALVTDGDAPNTCVADTTKITDCAAYTKLKADTTAKCQACVVGKILKENACTTAVTGTNCNTAYLNGETQVCTSCKAGFAFKGPAPAATCETAVTGALAGCLRVSDDVKTCLGPCNAALGYWNTDVNWVCTAFSPIATAAIALFASFFFSN